MADKLGEMGWGIPNLSIEKNLYNEQILYDVLSDNMPEKISFAYYRGETPIEKKIKALFQFDDGWSFFPVVDIIYHGEYRGENGGLEPGPQSCGCCVSYSHVLSLASKIAHEMYVDGDGEETMGDGELGCPFVGYSYGCSRVKVGGGMRGDGSLGQWIIKASQDFGFITCKEAGVSKPDPSSSITRNYGSSKAMLDKYQTIASQRKLKSTRLIKSYDDLWQNIVVEKSPCHIASNWGFSFSHNQDGMAIYKRSGSWAHQMGIQAAFKVNNNRYAYIYNQWGRNAHKNPGRELPKGGFIVTEELFDSWVKNAHCASISEVQTEKMILPSFQI